MGLLSPLCSLCAASTHTLSAPKFSRESNGFGSIEFGTTDLACPQDWHPSRIIFPISFSFSFPVLVQTMIQNTTINKKARALCLKYAKDQTNPYWYPTPHLRRGRGGVRLTRFNESDWFFFELGMPPPGGGSQVQNVTVRQKLLFSIIWTIFREHRERPPRSIMLDIWGGGGWLTGWQKFAGAIQIQKKSFASKRASDLAPLSFLPSE